MTDSSSLPPEIKPAKDEIGLLEVLRLLIDTDKVQTTSDLLKYTTQYGAPDTEERLKMLEAEGIPFDLAFDAVSVQLRLLAFKRNSALLAACRGQNVGLVLPLPPHLPSLFLPIAKVTFLQPGEDSHHGSMQEFTDQAIKGVRACRASAQNMQALVFEVCRENGELYAETPVAELIEPKMLPPDVRLLAHLRAHRNPGDVQIHPVTEVSFV
jgi:hypothetical protein